MKERILKSFASVSIKRPFLVILAFLIVICAAIYSAQNIRYEFAHSTYFSKDDPFYQQYTLYQKDFEVSTENAFIFIKADNVFSKECLEYMYKLSSSLREINYVSSVVSPADIVKRVKGDISESASENREIILKYAPNLVPKSTLGLIIVHVSTEDSKKIDMIAQEIERKIKFIPKPPGVHSAQPTGTVILWHQIKGAINEKCQANFGSLNNYNGFSSILYI